LAELECLEVLQLQHNQISGPIPTKLANCRKLKAISLHHNAIGGALPRAILQLPDLVYLVLNNNQLIGVQLVADVDVIIHADTKDSTSLRVLKLQSNRFTASPALSTTAVLEREQEDADDNSIMDGSEIRGNERQERLSVARLTSFLQTVDPDRLQEAETLHRTISTHDIVQQCVEEYGHSPLEARFEVAIHKEHIMTKLIKWCPYLDPKNCNRGSVLTL